VLASAEAAIARSRRRAVLAAAAPLLLAFCAVLVFALISDAGRESLGRTLAGVALTCAVVSLGPLATFGNLWIALPTPLLIVVAGVGWGAWLRLVRNTRVGNLPPLVHVLATGAWLGIGFAILFELSLAV